MRELEVFGVNRLKNVLSIDKNDQPVKITNVLKSDLLYLLSNYMEVSGDHLDVKIVSTAGGGYHLLVEGDVRRLKVLGAFRTELE